MESQFNRRTDRARFFLDILYPSKCPFCGKAIRWDMLSCDSCFAEIKWTDNSFCGKCGHSHCICGEEEIPFTRFYSAMVYNEKVKDAFASFKYHANRNLGFILCDMLADKMLLTGDDVKYDMIIPVPMNPLKKHIRGYNQAELMTRELAKRLDSVSDTSVICKAYSSKFQHDLNKAERAVNAENTFYPSGKRIDGKTVLLCDDITTTGSTMIKCGKLLKELGASRVDAAAGAVTGH